MPRCGFTSSNDAHVAPSLKISGPQSSLLYPRRGLHDGGSEVILCEEDRVILDQAEVCTIFNSFFANLATEIGKDCHIDYLEEHPSIQKIKQNLPTNTSNFSFQLVRIRF